MKYYLTFRSIN